jgi:dihydropteroate synthase
MGVLNVTPDSFYPASRLAGTKEAVERGLRLASEGAELLDIGGQSTRPGSESVGLKEELARVIPVIEKLSTKTDVPISVDTDKPEVARAAIAAGATVVNDINGLRSPGMLEALAGADAAIVMHMLGDSPKTMQNAPVYKDVVAEVKAFLRERAARCPVPVLVDPGIGFGKTLEHNLELIRRVDEFAALGPVVLGVSRKSFLGGSGPEARLEGSLAVACFAAQKGVKVLRVHDVEATRRALATWAALNP